MTIIINQSLKTSSTFPNNAELDKNDVNIFGPVSVLNRFSKSFENVMEGQLMPLIDNHLSVFLSAYRSSYSSQHVLIRLTEEWRQKLDSNHFVRAVLMDLSKVFGCIPHDLLIAKLSA